MFEVNYESYSKYPKQRIISPSHLEVVSVGLQSGVRSTSEICQRFITIVNFYNFIVSLVLKTKGNFLVLESVVMRS